jgi:predicted CoA-substrate-specific enzyme activase
MLFGFHLSRIGAVAATSSTPTFVLSAGRYDNRLCTIISCRRIHLNFSAILMAGAESLGLIRFDKSGRYLDYKSGTACAAGTGAFLDQQARYLGLAGSEVLAEIASRNKGIPPKIASRCAVFAKTDVVHASQNGRTLEEICDGLCHGLAENIVAALFKGRPVGEPVIFVGGVARNEVIAEHIEALIKKKIVPDPLAALHGAIGAALKLHEASATRGRGPAETDRVIAPANNYRKYFYEPLELKQSDFPEFAETGKVGDVEIDFFEPPRSGTRLSAYLGIDIGSTSSKAVLLDGKGKVLYGFYTKTAGQPLLALRKILGTLDRLIEEERLLLELIGAGTTGSGRKFIGAVNGADLVVDEITAHARAAAELNPAVDTIIEIGGQDSKFTVMKEGSVVFSVMNTICAAGTGSFIEAQAEQLGCGLAACSELAQHRPAPMISNRCTVFMERDISHYLNIGYTADEVMASVFHAIAENYLAKVAVEARIGSTVLFQGATAKNKSLVAAFEQRIGKAIHISKFCHLTGALGTALLLADRDVTLSRFRGLGICHQDPVIIKESCDFCRNHCQITVVEIGGERSAYGFLCGRDHDTRSRGRRNERNFDLLRERRRVFP